MRASGRVLDSTAVLKKSSTMATLTNSKQIPLDQLYKVEVPRYKFLISEYEVRKQRPSMLGKSLFHPREHWQPPGGLVTTDIKLLQGPQHAVIDRPRIVIEDESTHKKIVYVAGPYERDTCKHLRSWVSRDRTCGWPYSKNI